MKYVNTLQPGYQVIADVQWGPEYCGAILHWHESRCGSGRACSATTVHKYSQSWPERGKQ